MEKHFAELNLLDSDTDWKLTEAVNYTKTPSSHRICVKQIYQPETEANLVRQYSYEQTFDTRANARQIKASEIAQIDNKTCNGYQTTTELCFDSFKSFKLYKCNNILQAPKFIPSKTPNETPCNEVENINTTNESKFSLHCSTANMDAVNGGDHSFSTQFKNIETEGAEKKLRSTTNINKKTYQDIKNKFRPLIVKKQILQERKMNICCCSCLTLCIIPVVTVILAMFLNMNTRVICNHTMFFSNASQELQEKIYGQENAIARIVGHLDQDFFYLKVLCLVGGTGVGKSYTAEIIEKNFPLKKGIFTYDMLLENFINTNMSNSLDSHQLLVMENLKIKHLDTFSNIIDMLSQTKDKCITVIAIFNVEEVNNNLERKIDLLQSTSVIHEALANKKIDSLIVPYESLSEEALEICILQAAAASDLILTSKQLNEIKQGLLLFGSGCKGAYAKVQVVGRHEI